MKKLIIGISGVAGAGKDTFADILEKELDSFALSHDRYSLAEPLKKDVRGLIIEKFGIDILSCTREEKDLVRPLIVGFAEVTRKMSKGRIYTEQLQTRLEKSTSQVSLIPDVRFFEYEDDEVPWLRSMGGILVHIKRYDIEAGDSHGVDTGSWDLNRKYFKPPNEVEARNEDKVHESADYALSWPSSKRGYGFLNHHVRKFVQYLINERRISL